MNRVVAAARLHLFNPLIMLGIPWAILALSFAINVAIWALSDADDASSDANTGGVITLYIVMMVVFIQAVTQTLPYAMAVSLSRRSFYLGVALVAVVEALGYGIALSALVSIEDATDGWGVGLQYFAPGPMDVDNPFLQVFVSGAPMVAFMAIGAGMGVVHKRWGNNGVWGLIIGLTVVFGTLAILITWLDAWASIGGWLTEQSVYTLAVALPIGLTAVVGALAFAGIRRVVP